MRRFYFCLCFLLLGLLVNQNCAQDNIIEKQIASLEKEKPEDFKNVKPLGCVCVISVKTQEQFDGINDAITNAIAIGQKNIQIKISSGVYRFHECHIQRKNEQEEDVSISIEGKNVVVTSDAAYNDRLITEPWREMLYADTIIEVVDKDKKLCKMPYENSWSEQNRKCLTKVQITQWFRAPVYNVSKIDGTGIYFVASELKWEKGFAHAGYNVNFDYLYLGKTPRFRLYDVTRERQCEASSFVSLNDCKYRLFSISGIKFVSNSSGGALMGFNNVSAQQIVVKGCTFEYIQGNVVNASGTGNIVFDNNAVRNTYGNEVRFVNNCPNVRVTNNLFENCGQSIGNTFCVTCWESTYYVANNTFRDFGYGAIGVGVWHGFEKKHLSQGIIEHNEIYFTADYFANCWKFMLMDSGAIYTWTQNDEVIIRYNYIHDYTGAGDNRGIFCDDGANNLKIYRNVILKIPNSYCIDSRMSKDQKEGFTNNADNFMAQNVVDGRIRFQGYAGVQRHVVKGANYVIRKKGKSPVDNKFEYLEHTEKDVVLTDVNDGRVRKQIRRCIQQ